MRPLTTRLFVLGLLLGWCGLPSHPQTIGITVVYGVSLLLGYAAFRALTNPATQLRG